MTPKARLAPGRRALQGLLCAGLLLLPAAALRAEDEPLGRPAAPEREILLATVATDPAGDAERLAGQARAALASDRPGEAHALLVRLAEEHAETLIPLAYVLGPGTTERDGALRWPAAEAANLALARLPQAEQDRLAERWGADAGVLVQKAEAGDRGALEHLAARYGALAAGRQALRWLARRDLEAGRYARAARRLERWTWLRPDPAPAELAAAVAEWVDALHAIDDAGGVLALSKRFAAIAGESVSRGDRTATLDQLFWQKRPKPSPPLPAAEPSLPKSLVALWSRALHDDSRYGESWEDPDPQPQVVSAGAHVVGANGIILHEGRRVVRLDTRTGIERWRFPERPLARFPKPPLRYLWHDIPVRSVTPAGDQVLVVLGDPGASGSYQWRDEIQESSSLRDELRLRLVALDIETGAFRWATGRHDDTHPVLGDLATGVASPPLVVGERIYIGLAQRAGVGAYYAACLDRATGKPLWVRRVADGQSGRAPDRSDDDRFLHRHLQSLAWGARPAIADDELCFVPHAGLVAGLRIADGRLRWVRALPRYALSVRHDTSVGPSARNVPHAWGDAWVLAPLDCPQLVCLARGTGTLRWMRGPRMPTEKPVWRDLHAIELDAEGRPAVWLSTQESGIVLDARGIYAKPLNDVDPDTMVGGWTPEGARGYVTHGLHVRAERGQLVASGFFPDGDAIPRVEVELPYGAPASGDVHRVGDAWLLVGVDRVALVAGAEAVDAYLADGYVKEGERSRPNEAARAEAAVRGAMRARMGARPADLEGALERWASVTDAALRTTSGARIAEELTLWLDDVWGMTDEETTQGLALRWLKQLTPRIWELPVDLRGPGLYMAARAWLALGRGPEAVELLDRWIAEPGARLVASEPVARHACRVLLRGDLLAGELLRLTRAEHPSSQPALQRRERRHLDAVTALLEAPEPLLREAIRRAAGTEAAAVGRRRLAERLMAAGRRAAAASLRADLRLDPSPRERGSPTRQLRSAARLQIAEAELLVAAAEPEHARSLLVDVERWAPPGLRDARGRKLAAAIEVLRDAQALRPNRRGAGRGQIDVWPNLQAASAEDELGSVYWTGVRGPGSAHLGDAILLVRGLTPELWSLADGRRLAALPGDDEGWFGGRLQSIDAWLPGGGILVSSIVAGEPADTSKVQAGDWIRRWHGRSVPDLPSFISAVAASKPGEWVDVEVWRAGRRILDRFMAGRRPLDQPPRRTDDAYSALWVDADGRILFPARSGLDWIDVRARTRRRLWRWGGTGTILRTDVFAGEAYVTIERSGFDDLVVAVDIESGKERWRQAIGGSIQRVQRVGSALWVEAFEPGWTYVLDRFDGSTRSAVRTLTTRRDEYRRTWTVGFVSDAAPAGRGFVVAGHRSEPEMLCVNTTTGRVEWGQRLPRELTRRARGAGYLDPTLGADAVVVVLDSADALRVFLPDPLGRPPGEREVLIAGTKPLRTDSSDHGGSLSDDARLLVFGNTVHIVRNLRDRVTVWTVDIDFEELDRGRTGQPAGDPVVMRINERMLNDALGGRHQPYVIDCFGDHDGVYVTGATFGDEPWMEVRYTSDHGSVRLVNAAVLEARRHRPMRFGKRLIVPTDRGAEVFPLVPLGD